MIAIFVGLVFLGLIAAVRVMLYGVERQRADGDHSPRTFSASPALIASFCVVAGIVGYVALKAGVQPVPSVIGALVAAVVAAFGTARAVAKWWTVVPEHDIDDARYVLQGSIGRIVTGIGAQSAGQVSLEGLSPQRVLPARSIDDQALAAGTEVVIERIEDGVAYVEDWASVEKRL